MKIHSYLNFNGNCREAAEFYGAVFDAEPKLMSYGDMPDSEDFPLNEELKKLVIHAQIEIEGEKILLSDVMPGREFVVGNHISISLNGKDKEQLKKWFERLAEGGQVEMPADQTFWSEYYGCLTDRFGVCWQINYEKIT